MRIIRNDKFIQRRASVGRYVSLAGLIVLLTGLVISFTKPELFVVSFLSLIVGFICSQIGIYYGNRYARTDRPDEVLSKALKGFDDRYTLYQYTTPAGNLLLTPNAGIVFVVKLQAGPIEYREGRWRHRIGWKRILGFMTQESLGNPIQEAQAEANALAQYVAKKLPDVLIPIQPVIVFGNPNAEVDAATSPIPAVHAKKLKDWLRGPGRSGDLNPEAREKLIQLFGQSSA